jgi:hypothetical protein
MIDQWHGRRIATSHSCPAARDWTDSDKNMADAEILDEVAARVN